MMVAAIPGYVPRNFEEAPPGHRFRLYFGGWSDGWRLQDSKATAIAECARIPNAATLRALVERQRALAGQAPSVVVEATLAAPLATGLGMPHPVENGLAFLDPHGLPTLPGSSIKGAVRARAEAMALRGEEGWSLCALWWLFGFDGSSSWHEAAGRDAFEQALQKQPVDRLREFAALLDERAAEALRADPVSWLLRAPPKDLPRVRGALEFWDAIPVVDELDAEIMTPHHHEYLQAERPEPPLDHEEPKPIPFLVVPAGARLTLIAVLRPPGATPGWLRESWEQLARGALERTLHGRGFGAKTAIGFGRAALEDTPDVRRTELLAPAFVGGADAGRREHTALRASAIRGELRWWWRTMHAGFLTTQELRALEDAIWGSVRTGRSPVTVRVEAEGTPEVVLAPYKHRQGDQLGVNGRFLREHGIADEGRRGPGIAYAAYGMADGRNHRHVICPGARYRVGLEIDRGAQVANLPGGQLSSDDVRAQVLAAWRLFCAWGAVGAKSRKGFGSLRETSRAEPVPREVISSALEQARALRERLGWRGREYESERAAGALSLAALAAEPLIVTLPHPDPWWAMNVIGAAARDVATAWKHLKRKLVLGLPRRIHGPQNEPQRHQREHEPPIELRGAAPVGNRHASPVRMSLGRSPGGDLEVRLLAFIAGRLPDHQRSAETLREYVNLLQQQLTARAHAARPAGPGPRPPGAARAAQRPAPLARPPAAAPEVGRRVQVVLGRTKKGGWKGTFEEGGHTYSGPIVTGEAPSDVREGDRVEVLITSATPSPAKERAAQFAWPRK